jgi:tartrate dehydrogenase/decarboxylase/D-malate dehydrogenase
MADYTIAVIPDDGIGREVVPEGIRALDAVAAPAGLYFEWQPFGWSYKSFLVTGLMMPEDGLDQLGSFDAIFLGAVGFPGAEIGYVLRQVGWPPVSDCARDNNGDI